MKPTIRVSIGGLAFNLEEDAYQILDAYLQSLKKHFERNPEANEIINDIEIRVSELLTIRQEKNENVITVNDAQEIIKIMGNPKDFDDKNLFEEENINTSTAPKPENEKVKDIKIKKRLYRDVDNKLVGGVFSGLSHYLRVDVTLLRLLYVALFFLFSYVTFNSGPYFTLLILVYIILWIVMPKATTFVQKLSMTGSDPSILNITEDKRTVPPRKYRGSFISNFFNVFINVIVAIIAIMALIILVTLIVSFTWLYFDTEIFGINNYLILMGLNTPEFKIAILLVTLIPVIGLAWLMLKILKRSSFGTYSLISFIIGLIAWIGSIFYLTNEGVKFGVAHQYEKNFVDDINVNTQSENLYIRLDNNYLDANPQPNNPQMYSIGEKDDDKEIFLLPGIRIIKDSTLTDYKIEVNTKVFGNNYAVAERNASKLKFNYVANDSLVTIKPQLYSNEKPWDLEYTDIRIYTPKNKNVILSSPLSESYYKNHKIKIGRRKSFFYYAGFPFFSVHIR